MASWSLPGAVLFYLYTGLLIGGLTFPDRSFVPETWDQLIGSNFTFAVAKGTSMHTAFKVSNLNVGKGLWLSMLRNVQFFPDLFHCRSFLQ